MRKGLAPFLAGAVLAATSIAATSIAATSIAATSIAATSIAATSIAATSIAATSIAATATAATVNDAGTASELMASYRSGGVERPLYIDTAMRVTDLSRGEGLRKRMLASQIAALYLTNGEATALSRMGMGLLPYSGERLGAQDGLPLWFDESRQAFGVLTADVVVGLNEGWSPEFLRDLPGVIEAKASDFDERVILLKVESPLLALELSEELAAYTEVEFAHPDFLLPKDQRAAAPVTDTFFANQWHLSNTGQTGGTADEDINILPAWSMTLGHESIPVAIIDGGFDVGHEDLKDAWLINAKEIPNNRIDDDGNGFIDDVHGWNFSNNSANVKGGPEHGTAVAGLVAARMNGKGTVGTCPRCKLIPIASGFRPSQDAAAFNYARKRGARIITNSWGYRVGTATTDVVSKAISDVARNSNNGKGTLILFAMNNINKDDCRPNDLDISAIEEVFAVSGVDHKGIKVRDTAWGPCMEILSTTRAGLGNGIATTDVTGNSGYNGGWSSSELSNKDYTKDFGGTSAATPIAAGVFGLVLSLYPDVERQEAYSIVLKSAEKIRSADAQYNANGFSNKYGHGRIDAGAAVAETLRVVSQKGLPPGPGHLDLSVP